MFVRFVTGLLFCIFFSLCESIRYAFAHSRVLFFRLLCDNYYILDNIGYQVFKDRNLRCESVVFAIEVQPLREPQLTARHF